MFKNSDDEERFHSVLSVYKAEFGGNNLIVYLPSAVAEAVDPQFFQSWNVRFWKRNRYQIRVKNATASFFLTPED